MTDFSNASFPSTQSDAKRSRLVIAITNPFMWPHVRRGAERMLDDLTRYWLSQGHCVHVIALSPKHVEQSSTSSLHTTHCVPQKIFGKFRQLNACHQAAFSFQPILARIGETLDIVHCLNYFDAYAALQVRRRFGFRYRVLFQSVGIPTRSYFRSIPLDWYFFRQVLKSADGIITLSTFAHDYLLRDFQSPSVILPPPVDINRFSILLKKNITDSTMNNLKSRDAYRLLFVGDVNEPRKGARLLAQAYAFLIKQIDTPLELTFSGHCSANTQKKILSEIPFHCRDDVHFLGVGAVDALPHLYHAADLTVLPSVWEAFGLVVVESLAAGTPVVGVNHGGVPDILLGHEFDATGQQGVGLLFDADINIMSSENILNLVTAIRKSLLVCRSPDISTRCQVRAEAFSWLSLGQYYTMIYHQVLNDEIPCFESHSALESQLLPSLAHVENKASKKMNSSNTDTVTLSVIVPTHGRKLLIKRLLEALSRQSMRDEMEVIIIHNYTNDGSEHVCIDWTLAQSFPVRYFRKNFSGPAASRDFGAHAARGDLLAFIDDDCQPIPTWARAGVSGFTLPDVGLVQGRTQPMPGQKRCLFEKTVSVIHPSIFYETCNIFYRRSSFLSVGGFSPEFITRFYGEDTDLGWKVTLSGYQKHFVPEALVYHEVFQVTIMQWLKEPLFFIYLPYLAKKFPEFNGQLFSKWFLTPETALFNGFILSVLLSFLLGSPYPAVLSIPYFIFRFSTGSHMQSLSLRIARTFFGIPRSFLTWWALLKGSISARKILL